MRTPHLAAALLLGLVSLGPASADPAPADPAPAAPAPTAPAPEGPAAADASPAVLELLGHESWEKRLAGLAALQPGAGDAKAVRAVLPLLHDPDWAVQIAAAATLSRLGGDEASKALLVHAVEGEIAHVRRAAIKGLRPFDAAVVTDRLLSRLRRYRDDAEKVRLLEAVGALAPPGMVGRLRVLANGKGDDVAAAAVRALAQVAAREPASHEEVFALVAPLLKLRDKQRRFLTYAAAIEALGHVDLPRGRVALATELVRMPDDDPYIPTRIARALARQDPRRVKMAFDDALMQMQDIGARRRVARVAAEGRIATLAPLVAALRASAKEDARLDAEAARAHGLLGDPKDIPALLEGLAGAKHVRVRVEIVTALARLMAPDAFRDLQAPLLADASAEVRRQYVVELNDAGRPEAIPVLAAFVRDPDWTVATAAIASIGTLGVGTNLAMLTPLTRDRDWKIRGTAYEAMGRLRAAKAIPLLAQGLLDADPVVRGVCHANLQILSREKLDADPKVWRAWWRKHGEDLVLRKRSRMTPEENEAEEEERGKTRYAHEKYRFERRRGVEILQRARILVVSGAWDHVEVVLHHLKIPHTALRAQELKEVGLNPNQVVLVNCEGNVDKSAQERLRWFVNVGGYLMTTDWALTKTVQPCFPGYMAKYPGSTTGNDVVVVEDAAPGHPLTAGIFQDVPALMWWLEVRAFPITITYPERCEVLVDSARMKQRYGSSPMATVFRYGLGKVQHSVSHFYLQEEGLQQTRRGRDRMIFAADHLGLTLEQIRELQAKGAFDARLNEETMREIAPDYSMFRLIVNFVAEKEAWVEGL